MLTLSKKQDRSNSKFLSGCLIFIVLYFALPLVENAGNGRVYGSFLWSLSQTVAVLHMELEALLERSLGELPIWFLSCGIDLATAVIALALVISMPIFAVILFLVGVVIRTILHPLRLAPLMK